MIISSGFSVYGWYHLLLDGPYLLQLQSVIYYEWHYGTWKYLSNCSKEWFANLNNILIYHRKKQEAKKLADLEMQQGNVDLARKAAAQTIEVTTDIVRVIMKVHFI